NVGPGNHGVDRRGRVMGGLHIAHMPYRSADQVARKFRNGARALDAGGAQGWEGWHWRAGADLSPAAVERVWGTMRDGGAVPSLGWKPSGSWVEASLGHASWPLAADLSDR
ncbi:MAG: hypothetical protein ACK4MD_05295, partial [Demequina sp.]